MRHLFSVVALTILLGGLASCVTPREEAPGQARGSSEPAREARTAEDAGAEGDPETTPAVAGEGGATESETEQAPAGEDPAEAGDDVAEAGGDDAAREPATARDERDAVSPEAGGEVAAAVAEARPYAPGFHGPFLPGQSPDANAPPPPAALEASGDAGEDLAAEEPARAAGDGADADGAGAVRPETPTATVTSGTAEPAPAMAAEKDAGDADGTDAEVAPAAAAIDPPAPEGGDKAEASQAADRRSASAGFDHRLWDELLAAYVSPQGWVDYQRLRSESAAKLQRYLDSLAAASLDGLASRDEQKAFWINAYNALCVRKILDNDIPASVPKSNFFGTNIFKERTYMVAGEKRSLDDLEHVILRPRYRDDRVHAALVCAASSCPRLRTEAYRGDRLEEQLDEECRSWINTEKNKLGRRKNFLDRESRTFHASKIFDWYQEDFGGSDAGVLGFLERYLEPDERAFLRDNEVRVRYQEYDWSLNRQ